MKKTLTLTILNGPNRDLQATVEPRARMIVGRDPQTDFTVMDPRMSRRHFEVINREGDWVVRDLGSSNGTLVNGDNVAELKLGDGDTLAAGDTRFRVEFKHGINSRSSAASSTDVIDEQTGRQRTWPNHE